jgi:Ca2+-binding RTX toxin-like protein
MGGLDSDALYGGRGADVFSFLGDESIDRVHDFDRNQGDSIELFSSNFATLAPGEPLDPDAFFKGKNAKEGDDRIGYDQDSGKMYYDENGDGSGGRFLFAQFDKGTKIKASDIDVSPLGEG